MESFILSFCFWLFTFPTNNLTLIINPGRYFSYRKGNLNEAEVFSLSLFILLVVTEIHTEIIECSSCISSLKLYFDCVLVYVGVRAFVFGVLKNVNNLYLFQISPFCSIFFCLSLGCSCFLLVCLYYPTAHIHFDSLTTRLYPSLTFSQAFC